jgi:phospholipase C
MPTRGMSGDYLQGLAFISTVISVVRNRGRVLGAATLLAAAASIGLSSADTSTAAVSCSASAGRPVVGGSPQPPGPGDFTKIEHVIVIMQENRTFDHYFGTYPGADGIPRTTGSPTVCLPDPKTGQMVRPFHDGADKNIGGPHSHADSVADVDGGRMDRFVAQLRQAQAGCIDPTNYYCSSQSPPDVVGYHDVREIPNYWSYAKNFVLQDHMFEPASSWSLVDHLFMVSAWSARCTSPTDPLSCTNEVAHPIPERTPGGPKPPRNFAWTDLTHVLHAQGVTWGYYVATGTEPDCADGEMECPAVTQTSDTPGIWNPLPSFATVQEDGQLANIQPIQNFYAQAQAGSLPAVSWVVPDSIQSEHPPHLVTDGQAYVTGLINAVMSGPNWSSSAIFVSWDDWGGFYDHVIPPVVDENGYGIRVPGLLISPYAKHGFIDHQVLSFDGYLKFIEDRFLGGQRLDPATDGRPDPRPTVRESVPGLGDMRAEFDFTQAPRPPSLLPTHPPIGPSARITLTPSSGPPGAPARIDGVHFFANETVAVQYKTGLSGTKKIVLCTARASTNGTVSCNATIPTTNQGAQGPHTIVATGYTSMMKAKATFTLTG